MRNYLFPALTIAFIISLFASCARKPIQTISFAFYNVENLFDTIDDPHIRDNSHLPDSKVPWNTERYQHKLDNLAKVISSVDTTGFPTLFGLCEVENADVVFDLVNHSDLVKASYSFLHKDSPDERGIDVAMLFQSKYYTPVETNYIKLIFPWDPTNNTRDILYSKGIVGKNDTLHIFINHWVSRWGGQEKTEPSRRFIGKTLKHITDSIFNLQPDANIIIAGDLNDNPTDLSISEDLGALAVSKPIKDQTLYNLSHNLYVDGQGSLYYRSWDMFDQIIVSSSLLAGNSGFRATSEKQTVIKHDWMLYHPKKGVARPSRTSSGGKYFGGYSDHLPVFIRLSKK